LPAEPELEAGLHHDRQALHAAALRVRHPIHGEDLHFEAPLPADLARLIRILRHARGPARRVEIAGATLDLDKLLG
jgi:23S rRNA pseudouridine1911/1915/1917 synthase